MTGQKRLVQWNRPVENKYGHLVYTAKNSTMTIEKRKIASSRNGCWNAHVYRLTRQDGSTTDCESLDWAKLMADYVVDPNWDPDAERGI